MPGAIARTTAHEPFSWHVAMLRLRHQPPPSRAARRSGRLASLTGHIAARWSNRGQLTRKGLICAALTVFAFSVYPRPQGLSGAAIVSVGTCLILVALFAGLGHPRPLILPWTFVLLAAASSIWSGVGVETVFRAAGLGAPLIISGLIANNAPFRDFLRIADVSLKIAVVLSLLAAIVLPSVGQMQRSVNAGTLRGIYVHRNGMGYVIVIALITHLAVYWGRHWRRPMQLSWPVVYFVGLYLARSSAAVVLTAIAIATYGAVWLLARQTPAVRSTLVLTGLAGLVPVGILAYLTSPVLLGWIGRDATFSGRTDIWSGAIAAWRQRFWAGYGFGNILDSGDAAAETIKGYAGYLVRSTHNGYLSTALQLGVVGLAISVLILLRTIGCTVRLAALRPGPQALWSLQIVAVLIVGDFVETRAFVNIGWFMLTLIGYYYAQTGAESSTSNRLKRPSISLPWHRSSVGVGDVSDSSMPQSRHQPDPVDRDGRPSQRFIADTRSDCGRSSAAPWALASRSHQVWTGCLP